MRSAVALTLHVGDSADNFLGDEGRKLARPLPETIALTPICLHLAIQSDS